MACVLTSQSLECPRRSRHHSLSEWRTWGVRWFLLRKASSSGCVTGPRGGRVVGRVQGGADGGAGREAGLGPLSASRRGQGGWEGGAGSRGQPAAGCGCWEGGRSLLLLRWLPGARLAGRLGVRGCCSHRQGPSSASSVQSPPSFPTPRGILPGRLPHVPSLALAPLRVPGRGAGGVGWSRPACASPWRGRPVPHPLRHLGHGRSSGDPSEIGFSPHRRRDSPAKPAIHHRCLRSPHC